VTQRGAAALGTLAAALMLEQGVTLLGGAADAVATGTFASFAQLYLIAGDPGVAHGPAAAGHDTPVALPMW
jgi:hypothetical protein